jgi:pimeloyl-ACP methyl ester carboxylesterase
LTTSASPLEKPPLLLLHGALGTEEQFEPLRPLLEPHYTLHTLTFEGHGSAPPERPYRMEHFAENVLGYLAQHELEGVPIFGYSMGGYAALSLARQQPGATRAIATLATKFAWTPEVAAREERLLDAATIREKVPRFAQALQARHAGAGWEQVLSHTAEMMHHLGAQPTLQPEDLAALAQPVRIIVGDRDATVSIEESLAVVRALPSAELEVLPGTPHPFEKVPLERLARTLLEFFGRF